MHLPAAVQKARGLLEDVTPLALDCGRFCAAACCQGDDETGMLLFPGEETLYEACDFGEVMEAEYALAGRPARLFVCRGTCPRASRPLACRLFPLLPRLKDGAASVAMDHRAACVCPLHSSGVQGLSPAFVQAAQEAAEALLADPACRAWLQDLWGTMAL